MNLGIITPNIFFGESLKSLIESYGFTKERYITLKDVTSKNIEQLDVIISDYKWNKLEDFLLEIKLSLIHI